MIFLVLQLILAHDAPTGWTYDQTCCGGSDCRPIQQHVRELPQGYQVPSGETIPYGDPRVRDSKDGDFHWCTKDGKVYSHTICIYVPGKGS